jgi:iron-sulfur cluster assembly accessory protein
MTLPEETLTTSITLTQMAANAVREVMAQKNLQGYALRLYVTGGGCSGYQYGLALDNRTRDEDAVFDTDGIKLLVDEVSIKYLNGASVDYVEGEDVSGFRIINPNPLASCNCSQNAATGEENNSCSGCN